MTPPASVSQGAKEPAVSAFTAHFAVLCSLLIMVSLVTSSAEVLQLFSGAILTTEKAASNLRLLREGVYVVLLADFVLACLTASSVPLMNRMSALLLSGGLLLVGICAFRGLMLDVPPVVIASGLRFLEYLPLALVAAIVCAEGGDTPFERIGRWILVFLIIETLLAVVETRFHAGLYGRTFIGSRAFGTFVHPNIFGATIAFCYLFLVSTMPRWRLPVFLMCLFDVLASGSRSGMMGMLVVILILRLFQIRNLWFRLTTVLAGILLSPVVLLLGTNPALTGRQTGIGSGGFERLDVWARVLSKLHTVSDILLGWGMGLGSNTVFTLFGHDIEGTYISDNTFFFLLGSFGIIGVALAIIVLCIIFYQLKNDSIGAALFGLWLLQILVSQAMETYPENAMAMILLGWRIGVVQRSRWKLRGQPHSVLGHEVSVI